MKDVARHVGVSQATVSYVLNDSASVNIPAETRQRVWVAIRELGYRRNNGARQMRTQRTHLLGLITDVIATTPFAGAIIKGAQDAARAAGKLLLLVSSEGEAAVEKAAVETLLEHRVEGIIYAAMYHRPVQPPTSLRETVAVLADCFIPDRSIASITPDEVRGGRAATEVLLHKQHRRIGFINNTDAVPATTGRLAGYRQALAAAGVAFDEALVRRSPSTPTGGYTCALDLLRQPNRPTALFCFNDRIAMGAYDAARKLNLAIPNDIAIIGFDNQEIIADSLHPGLSTMQLPHYEMGVWSVKYVLGEMDTQATEQGGGPIQKVLECPYVARASV
jgi:LacI family transcriptional regulator